MSQHSPHHPAHPYHLLPPSPWPLIGSISAFVTAYGAIGYFHDRTQTTGLWIGLGLVIITMIGWWRSVLQEAQDGCSHTPVVRHGLRLGMVLFIASEVMFFVAFFWAFFHMASGTNPNIPDWPPSGIEPLHTFGLPFINTLILVSSGMAVNWAHHGLQRNERAKLVPGLFVAVALGLIFLGLQAFEYGQATFGFADGPYPSVFYMATGFHGFHVLVGVCFLTVCLGRALKGHFTRDHHVGFEAAAWYWHFVDVVWIFLFVWIYWWGNG